MDAEIGSFAASSELPPDALEHFIGCTRCRSLMRVLNQNEDEPAPSERELQRIREKILVNLKPVRPMPPFRILLFVCALIFLSVVTVGILALGMSGWGALSVEQRIVVFATLAASAVLLAVSMVRQMAPGSKHTLSPAVLPTAILCALMVMIAAMFRSQKESAFVATGLMCMRNGLTYSLPAGILFWLLLRRGAVLFPKLIGAAAGGLAGLVGLSVLEVNCPNLNVFHIAVWHWGVILLSSLAGLVLGAAVEYIERWRHRELP
jgi:hypothetical protein